MSGVRELRAGSLLQDTKAALQAAGLLASIKFEDSRYLIVKLNNFSKDVRFDFGSTNSSLGIMVGDWQSGSSSVGFSSVLGTEAVLSACLVSTNDCLIFGRNATSASYHGGCYFGKSTAGNDVVFGWHQVSSSASSHNAFLVKSDNTLQSIKFHVPVHEIKTSDFKYLSTEILLFDFSGLVILDTNNMPLKVVGLKALTKSMDTSRAFTVLTDERQFILEGGYYYSGSSALSYNFPTSFVLNY